MSDPYSSFRFSEVLNICFIWNLSNAFSSRCRSLITYDFSSFERLTGYLTVIKQEVSWVRKAAIFRKPDPFPGESSPFLNYLRASQLTNILSFYGSSRTSQRPVVSNFHNSSSKEHRAFCILVSLISSSGNWDALFYRARSCSNHRISFYWGGIAAGELASVRCVLVSPETFEVGDIWMLGSWSGFLAVRSRSAIQPFWN